MLTLFELNSEELAPDLRVIPTAVARKRWGNHFERPTDQVGLELRRNRVPKEVITLDNSEIDKDSSGEDTYSSYSSSDDSSR